MRKNAIKDPISCERVRELLDYNPETGALHWKKHVGAVAGGWEAGHVTKDGYRVIRIDFRLYKAHRIIWLWMTGEWPSFDIDHKNIDPSDNRWDNLRPATARQNIINCRRKSESQLPRGVSRHGGRFRARLYQGRGIKSLDLGIHDTAEAAHQAWLRAARERHGEFVPSSL